MKLLLENNVNQVLCIVSLIHKSGVNRLINREIVMCNFSFPEVWFRIPCPSVSHLVHGYYLSSESDINLVFKDRPVQMQPPLFPSLSEQKYTGRY